MSPSHHTSSFRNHNAVRFDMTKPFKAEAGARGFQLSNPPVFQCASLLASLEIVNAVGMKQIRAKSLLLTGYLQLLLQRIDGVSFITPTEANERGAQVSQPSVIVVSHRLARLLGSVWHGLVWFGLPCRHSIAFAKSVTLRFCINQVSILVAVGAETMFSALESRLPCVARTRCIAT